MESLPLIFANGYSDLKSSHFLHLVSFRIDADNTHCSRVIILGSSLVLLEGSDTLIPLYKYAR